MNTYNSPLNNALDHFLNHSLNEVFGVNNSSNTPSVNISEDNETHYLEIAIPGVPKEDISLSIEQDKLIVKADKKEVEYGEKEHDFIRREFNYTSFSRSFTIPETADISKIDAKYNAGILKISLSKKEEAVDHGPIDIKIS